MIDPEINGNEIYRNAWSELSKRLDEYIELTWGDNPILDSGSNLDVYCYVLDKLIQETKNKNRILYFGGGH